MSDQLHEPDPTALRLGISPRTLERWRRTGEGPRFVRLGGVHRGRVRYPETAITEYLGERARRSNAAGGRQP